MSVKFNKKCKVYYTYSQKEYNRHPIYISYQESISNRLNSMLMKLQGRYTLEEISYSGFTNLWEQFVDESQKELKEKLLIVNK